MKTTKLRFAPICRVSTEKQENKGQSLATQTMQIKQYVQSLDGVIPDNCWQYSGQEHATVNQERSRMDKLLQDSAKDIFDAVIVCDCSRWSRDNLKNKQGLKTLLANGIRFFVATMEYDLYNPEHSFYLGISAEIGELHARQQNLKSITNRIERAKHGMNACGKRPYGRIWDKTTNVWSIDPEKQAKIQQAATRYLDGESIKVIATTLDMNFTNLWKILNKRSGTKWECRFRYENIDETVVVTVPPLLDDHTIAAIHERARANKTYTHGQIKHRYLLSRMIFCEQCGYALFGYTNDHGGRRYYRHIKHEKTGCKFTKFVPADELENSVLLHLIQTFGDVERIQKAIKKATPDLGKIDSLNTEHAKLTHELKRTIIQKDRVVDMVANGSLNKTEVKYRMDKLRDREQSIKLRLTAIEIERNSIPDPQHVKRLSKLGMQVISDATRNNPKAVFKKSYDWKRNLIEHAFTGKDVHGKRLGVYIRQTSDELWEFEIRGTLETVLLTLPLSDEYLINAFKLDSDFQDVSKELDKIKSSFAKPLLKQTIYSISGSFPIKQIA